MKNNHELIGALLRELAFQLRRTTCGLAWPPAFAITWPNSQLATVVFAGLVTGDLLGILLQSFLRREPEIWAMSETCLRPRACTMEAGVRPRAVHFRQHLLGAVQVDLGLRQSCAPAPPAQREGRGAAPDPLCPLSSADLIDQGGQIAQNHVGHGLRRTRTKRRCSKYAARARSSVRRGH